MEVGDVGDDAGGGLAEGADDVLHEVAFGTVEGEVGEFGDVIDTNREEPLTGSGGAEGYGVEVRVGGFTAHRIVDNYVAQYRTDIGEAFCHGFGDALVALRIAHIAAVDVVKKVAEVATGVKSITRRAEKIDIEVNAWALPPNIMDSRSVERFPTAFTTLEVAYCGTARVNRAKVYLLILFYWLDGLASDARRVQMKNVHRRHATE